jgi:hypothetical protein
VRRAAVLVLAWAVSLGAMSFAHAQAYKWTDADGKVRYGDKPPEGARQVEDRTSTHGKVKGEAKAGRKADKRHKKRMAAVDKDLAKRKKAADKSEAEQARRKQAYEQCVASRRTDC